MGGLSGFFKKALPYAAGAVAGGVSNQFSALQPFSAAISAGAGALTNSKNRLGGALQGFAGGGIGSAIAGGLSSKTGFGGGAWEGLKGYGGSIPGFGGIGTSNPTGVFSKFFTPQTAGASMSKMPNGASGMVSTGRRASFVDAPWKPSISTPSFNSGAPAASGMTKTIQDSVSQLPGGKTNWGQFAGGLALPAVASALTPDVKASDFSPVTGPLKEQIMNSKNPDALAFYKQQLAANPVDSTPGLAVDKRAHDKQLAETLRSFDQQWQAAMGGQDPSNNSEYQKQRMKIMSDAEANWTANQSQFQFQYDQLQKQQQYAAAAALQGMDDSQLSALASLAQYDIYQIAQQTGMDIASSEQIQQLAATAGSLLMQKSLGLTGNAGQTVQLKVA